MTPEQKTQYKRLARQVCEAQDQLFDRGTYGRIKNKKPNLFNNRLQRMKDFLNTCEGDFSKNRFMIAKPIEQ